MSTGWQETIEPLEWRPEDPKALNCACCGGPPSLWEVDREGTITKMVNCDRAELAVGKGWPYEQECPMYSPRDPGFNRATRREAINYWNRMQQALIDLREHEVPSAQRLRLNDEGPSNAAHWHKVAMDAEAENERLRAWCAELERDAERYRFVRTADKVGISAEAARDPVAYDDAIDRAMERAKL